MKVAHLSSLLAYGKTERIEAWVGTEFRYNKSPRERDDKYVPLAHLVEHSTFNAGVRSSSLRWRTMLVNRDEYDGVATIIPSRIFLVPVYT